MPKTGKIKNFESLLETAGAEFSQSQLRRHALMIVEAGLAAIDTRTVIQKNVSLCADTLMIAGKEIDIGLVRRLIIIGIGKCGLEAAGAIEEILGNRITGGAVLDARDGSLKKLRVFSGTHPFPSEKNINATREIIALLTGLKREDLVIFVISGGGSTLLCQPQNITHLQEEMLLKRMFETGADIREINTLRKHLSLARGGFLAKYAYPAAAVSLIFSDVPGGETEFVSSGPTVLDTTTIDDAKKLSVKYGLEKHCEIPSDAFIETPKDEKYFANVRNVVVVSNEIALEEMRRAAESFGFRAVVDKVGLDGEAKEQALAMTQALAAAGPGSAILWGGESTVTMKNSAKDGKSNDAAMLSKGGRNLEFALSALAMTGKRQIVVSVASDGRDNTDFAGGIADTLTRAHAVQLKLEPSKFLESHSSYDFFSRTGDYILTGNTGSNVADLSIALYEHE